MLFKQYSGYYTKLKAVFHEDLNGLTVYNYMFHTKEANETTKYNNWNFTNNRIWDSYEEGFWFNEKTTVLYKT